MTDGDSQQKAPGTLPPVSSRDRRSKPSVGLRSSDYLSMRPLMDWLADVATRHVHGMLLDYGCGNQPYRPLFEPAATKYLGAAVAQNVTGTVEIIVRPGEPLPLEAESSDTVLSTQVLEHVTDPPAYLREVSRILRRGGVLILTCPASYMLHEEPNDYFRFTKYGLASLLSQAGLEVVEIDEAGGAWRLMGQIFINHLVFGRRRTVPVLTGIFMRIAVPACNIIFGTLDRLNRNEKDTVNYMAIARKA